MQWQLDERDSEHCTQDTPQRSLLLIAVLASLLLHGVITVTLLRSVSETTVPLNLGAVRINLMPTNPQHMPSPPESVAEVLAEPISELVPGIVEELPDLIAEEFLPVQAPELPRESVVEAVIPDSPVPAPAIAEEQGGALITLPSLLSVQQSINQSIEALDADNDARSWLYTCNKLEEDSGVRKCAESNNAEVLNRIQRAERNTVYEALNPVRERSRTERSVRSVYQNTTGIAAALNTNAIPAALAGYVLGELEAGTSLFTNNGTDRNEHMWRMVDRSAAAKQAERVLLDPWIQIQSEELRQRNVHSN